MSLGLIHNVKKSWRDVRITLHFLFCFVLLFSVSWHIFEWVVCINILSFMTTTFNLFRVLSIGVTLINKRVIVYATKLYGKIFSKVLQLTFNIEFLALNFEFIQNFTLTINRLDKFHLKRKFDNIAKMANLLRFYQFFARNYILLPVFHLSNI